MADVQYPIFANLLLYHVFGGHKLMLWSLCVQLWYLSIIAESIWCETFRKPGHCQFRNVSTIIVAVSSSEDIKVVFFMFLYFLFSLWIWNECMHHNRVENVFSVGFFSFFFSYCNHSKNSQEQWMQHLWGHPCSIWHRVLCKGSLRFCGLQDRTSMDWLYGMLDWIRI